jgi:hypothetical protein
MFHLFRADTQQARLPEDLEELTPAVTGIGESVWMVPWAMWVDGERRCWLATHFTAHEFPGGTVSMKVTRQEDGYVVDLGHVTCHEQWLLDTERVAEPGKDAPVIKIIR